MPPICIAPTEADDSAAAATNKKELSRLKVMLRKEFATQELYGPIHTRVDSTLRIEMRCFGEVRPVRSLPL